MHCSDIEWKNEMEKQAEAIIDHQVYLPLIQTLRQKHRVSLQRSPQQKSQYHHTPVRLVIDEETYFIEEQWVWSDEALLYFDVSYRQIKPWPPKRRYSYLFDDWSDAHHLYLFFTYMNGSYTFYLMTGEAMSLLLTSCQLTQEQLLTLDRQVYKKKTVAQINEHYALYCLEKWRSQRTVLALNETQVATCCVFKQKEDIDELHHPIIRY